MYSPICLLPWQYQRGKDLAYVDVCVYVCGCERNPRTAHSKPYHSVSGPVRSVLHVRCRAEDIGVSIITMIDG